ncbi:MAG: hypothetical protein V7L14_24260 [Nostoc sp.]|uniref:hypothetical protein n=1 Tax=Nostoc sp. TaxID=1180 RepID=UPI002FF6E6B5
MKRETFKVELPISCRFDYPTVVELDQQISEYRQNELGLITPSLKPVPRNTKELPISLTQLELRNSRPPI